VGVQRQYSGTLGRIDNCQIATFLAYVTPGRDRVLLDRRLYLPEGSWVADPTRCAQAGVPPNLAFKTRPQQVREMIESTLAAGVPFAWFTADEEFGQNPGLCDYLEASRIPYVMAVPKTTQFTDATKKKVQFDALAPRLSPNSWQRRSCGIGSKGFRVYDWALIDSDHPDHQYLIRDPSTTVNSRSTTATTHTTQDSQSLSAWPERAGPSKSASDPAKMKSDSTTTKSAPGTPGTDISPSRSSPTPSSPSPHTQPKKGAPASRTTKQTRQSTRQADRT
jgi:SRSO17 transposase